jgi:hypothetical protein
MVELRLQAGIIGRAVDAHGFQYVISLESIADVLHGVGHVNLLGFGIDRVDRPLRKKRQRLSVSTSQGVVALQIRLDHFLAVQETVFIDGEPAPFGNLSQRIV